MRREEGEVIRGETAAPARNCPAEGGMLASCHQRQIKRPREGTVAGCHFVSVMVPSTPSQPFLLWHVAGSFHHCF